MSKTKLSPVSQRVGCLIKKQTNGNVADFFLESLATAKRGIALRREVQPIFREQGKLYVDKWGFVSEGGTVLKRIIKHDVKKSHHHRPFAHSGLFRKKRRLCGRYAKGVHQVHKRSSPGLQKEFTGYAVEISGFLAILSLL